MYRRIAGWVLMTGVILTLAGCASAPTEQVSAAEQAMNQAAAAEADKYVPDEFQKAQTTLDEAQTALKAEDEKFSMFRDYDPIKTKLSQATEEFNSAAQAAEMKKEEVQKQNQQALADAEQALASAQAALEKAPRGKGSQADLEQMRADLDAASAALDTARQQQQAGNFLDAQSQIQSAKSKADAVSSQVEEAIKARRGRR